MRFGLAAVLFVGCTAPPIGLSPSLDAGDASAADSAPTCPSVRGPDGGFCSGADEDLDCTPDGCDPCPNVPEPRPLKAAGITTVGSACTHPRAPFDALVRRAFFEPFDDLVRFSELSPRLTPELSFRAEGGRAVFDGGMTRVLWAKETATLGDVVATAIFDVPEDSTPTFGVVLRFDEGARSGIACDFRGNAVVVDRLQCNGESQCALTPLTGEKDHQGIALWTGRILVRAAVFGGTRFECQVFKAPTVDQVSGTLRSLDDASTVDLDAHRPRARRSSPRARSRSSRSTCCDQPEADLKTRSSSSAKVTRLFTSRIIEASCVAAQSHSLRSSSLGGVGMPRLRAAIASSTGSSAR